jgi:hypothetical protein
MLSRGVNVKNFKRFRFSGRTGVGILVRLKFSAVSTPLKSLKFVVYWTMRRRHCYQAEEPS